MEQRDRKRKVLIEGATFYHFHVGTGIATVAVTPLLGPFHDRRAYSIALCSPRDAFSRKRAGIYCKRRLSEFLKFGNLAPTRRGIPQRTHSLDGYAGYLETNGSSNPPVHEQIQASQDLLHFIMKKYSYSLPSWCHMRAPVWPRRRG
jgi:hypothetical protein